MAADGFSECDEVIFGGWRENRRKLGFPQINDGKTCVPYIHFLVRPVRGQPSDHSILIEQL